MRVARWAGSRCQVIAWAWGWLARFVGSIVGQRELDFPKAKCWLGIASSRPAGPPPAIASEPQEDLSLEDYFQRFVLEHQDSMSETELAQKLGVSRKCLWERRQRLGIPRSKGNSTRRKSGVAQSK